MNAHVNLLKNCEWKAEWKPELSSEMIHDVWCGVGFPWCRPFPELPVTSSAGQWLPGRGQASPDWQHGAESGAAPPLTPERAETPAASPPERHKNKLNCQKEILSAFCCLWEGFGRAVTFWFRSSASLSSLALSSSNHCCFRATPLSSASSSDRRPSWEKKHLLTNHRHTEHDAQCVYTQGQTVIILK